MRMKINRTVERAIQMLELIGNTPKGITLNEIIEQMDIPKSSGFDILHTLIHNNMVQKLHPGSKMYVLGVKSFIIGNNYINKIEIIDMIKPCLKTVGEKYGKSLFIGQDTNDKIVYIYKYQPTTPTIVASCMVGMQNEYYNIALGRCILAFKPNAESLVDQFWKDGKIKINNPF